jgi:hypothetical protein
MRQPHIGDTRGERAELIRDQPLGQRAVRPAIGSNQMLQLEDPPQIGPRVQQIGSGQPPIVKHDSPARPARLRRGAEPSPPQPDPCLGTLAMDELRAAFNRNWPEIVIGPDSPTDPVARLQDYDTPPGIGQRARRAQPGRTSPDYEHIHLRIHKYPFLLYCAA